MLFYLPGEWKGALCEQCGRAGFPDAFQEHFGTVQHVADGDAGKGHVKA